jgi:hypothetical protein
MTHEETVAALHKSMLMPDTPEDRHGVYPKRTAPPVVEEREPRGAEVWDDGWSAW